jgi:hypothetical protein
MNWLSKLSTNYHAETTDLCLIMKKCKSDKGLGWHNYTTLYTLLFESLRHTPINIFEVGLGTNNVNVPSNMGPNGTPGASLRGWQQYFDHPDTKVVGADVDKGILFNEGNITTHFVDQLNTDTIQSMWSTIPDQFDIILDDGLHTFEANWNFLQNSIHKVKKGGFYIVEDLLPTTADEFRNKLSDLKTAYNCSYVDVIKIPNPQNNGDNTVLVMIL